MKKYILTGQDGEIITRYIEGVHSTIPDDAVEISQELFDQSMEHTHYINGELSTVTPEPTDEQLLAQLKRDRERAVSEITVTVDNMVFDGDETSQDRMSRAIVSLDPLETTLWVLHDNTVAYPTREQLKQALRLAGSAQTDIWVLN